jgi:hypothetical protein
MLLRLIRLAFAIFPVHPLNRDTGPLGIVANHPPNLVGDFRGPPLLAKERPIGKPPLKFQEIRYGFRWHWISDGNLVAKVKQFLHFIRTLAAPISAALIRPDTGTGQQFRARFCEWVIMQLPRERSTPVAKHGALSFVIESGLD